MQKVRIISGKWGGRKVSFPDIKGLRPTPDRIRETLFNWLGNVSGLTVLDLFAGSGVLGFEALSRGAKQAWFVDQQADVIRSLVTTSDQFNATEICKIQRRRFPFPCRLLMGQVFDLVFLDPPYDSSLLWHALVWLQQSSLVHDNTMIYIEYPLKSEVEGRLNSLSWHKHSHTQQIAYGLIIASALQPLLASLQNSPPIL